METITDEFKTLVIEALKSKADDWDLINVEFGEDRVLAKAGVLGIRAGGMVPPDLRIVQRKGMISVEIRNIARVGSAGAAHNRVPHALNRHLVFGDLDDDASKFADTIEKCQLHSHQFLLSPRTPEELLVVVIAASNDNVMFTKACIDTADGEVYVSAVAECDYDKLPDSFLEVAGGVLSHAARIARFIRLMRVYVIPQTPPSREEITEIFEMREAKKKENAKQPTGSEMTI